MTAPYAPRVLFPLGGEGAAASPDWTFRVLYRAPDALQSQSYLLERQKISPTTGSVEYYDSGTGQFETVSPGTSDTIANIEGDEELEITLSSDDWDADSVYQWRIRFTNESAETGPPSDWAIFTPRFPITMTLDVADPSTDSRPVIRWSAAPSAGTGRQRGYRLAVIPKAVYDDVNFDADDPGWMSLASWEMDEFVISTDTFSHRIGTDLPSSGTFRVLGRIMDEYGIDSGWQVGPEFTQSFTPPAAPEMSVELAPELGLVYVTLDAAFNLAGVDSAGFRTGVGKWVNANNALLEHVTTVDGVSNPAMKVTVVGATYEEMDAAHTDYAADDAAYTDHEDQRTTLLNFTSGARVWYNDPFSDWIAAVPAEDYSAVISLFPEGVSITAELIMRFYDDAGNFLSETSVTATSCPANSWTEVATGAAESPANTAFIRPTLELFASVDDVVYVDNFAIAKSSEVEWSPGGSSADLQFNLSRRIGDGPWEYVWNASRSNPTRAEDASYSVAVIPDRAFPIGSEETVTYRGVVVSEATGRVVSSAVAEVVSPTMYVEAWWLRCVDGTLPDCHLKATGFDHGYDPPVHVFRTAGQDHGTVVDSGEAPSREASVTAYLFNASEYECIRNMMESGKLLYLQRNIGDGFYLRVTGGVRYAQRTAKDSNDRVRHFHSVRFNAEIVGPPEDVVQ